MGKQENLKKIFTSIYKTNHWGSYESVSGPGSEIRQTKVIRKKLPKIIEKFKIKTMLDIPCGDFNWMKEVNLSDLKKYIGADIVDEIVYKNNKKYKSNRIQFLTLDLVKSLLPRVDLVFCRDCLVHLNFGDIKKAIKNIKKSGSTFLLTTTFQKEKTNFDTQNAKWRPINLTIKPFSFPPPIEIIRTNFTDKGKHWPGNGMGLWLIQDL